jgi:hypothetical protein
MPFSLSVQFIEQVPFSLDIHRQARDWGHWPHSKVALLKLLFMAFDFIALHL